MRRRTWTKSQKREVYNKTEGHCAYCGVGLRFEEMKLDHVVSLHNHGADDISNLMPACQQCNYYKKGCNPDGFRKKLKKAFRKEKKSEYVQCLQAKYGDDWDGVFYFEKVKS